MNNNNRLHVLDSLRGIACLQVVVGHSLNALPSLTWMYDQASGAAPSGSLFYLGYSPLNFFWAGTKAVKVFFVLSGFVLSLPYYTKDITTSKYLNFFNKRILRLYLPCLAIILLSLLVKYTYYNQGIAHLYGPFVNGFLSEDFSGRKLVQTLLLGPLITNLNPAMWTLPPEIKLSLILPFFAYLLKRSNWLWCCAAIVLMAVLNKWMKAAGIYQVLPDMATLYWMTFFLIGAVICKYRIRVIQWINSLGTTTFVVAGVVSVFLYTFNYSMWWLPKSVMAIMMKYEDYIIAIPATLFLILSLSNRLNALLSHKASLFLGKISFSLYLVHAITIYSTVYLLGMYLSKGVTILTGFLLCFPVAYLFYRSIEVPSLRFSKYFADRISGILTKKKFA